MKRAANLSVDQELLEQAKAMKINLSKTLEQGLLRAIKEKQALAWKQENRAALEGYNQWVESNGLPLAQYRRF